MLAELTLEYDYGRKEVRVVPVREATIHPKKEGIKHILCPFENKKDLDEIIEKHPDLFNLDFTVEMINNIYDILDRVLLDKIDYVRI